MQGPPTYGAEPNGLPLSEKLLPEYLRELGYTTRAIGKWHLGFYKPAYTPTRRGFDSHFGYYTGYVSYYDYILQDVVSQTLLLFYASSNFKVDFIRAVNLNENLLFLS